jgi:hypothetical protein
MAAPQQSKVIKGFFYPGSKELQSVVAALKKNVKTDAEFAKTFKKNPRATLANMGMNEDVQRELLQDMDRKARLSICICTACCKTCWCTKCCLTKIVIDV